MRASPRRGTEWQLCQRHGGMTLPAFNRRVSSAGNAPGASSDHNELFHGGRGARCECAVLANRNRIIWLGLVEGVTPQVTPHRQVNGRRGYGGARGGYIRSGSAAACNDRDRDNAGRTERGRGMQDHAAQGRRGDREAGLADGAGPQLRCPIQGWQRPARRPSVLRSSWSVPSQKQVAGGMIYGTATFHYLSRTDCNHSAFGQSG